MRATAISKVSSPGPDVGGSADPVTPRSRLFPPQEPRAPPRLLAGGGAVLQPRRGRRHIPPRLEELRDNVLRSSPGWADAAGSLPGGKAPGKMSGRYPADRRAIGSHRA